MICQEVQMQLSAFLDKSLDAIRLKGIETHLSACSACRAEATSLSECIRRVADLPIVEPPAGFAQRVMAHVREIEIEPRGWHRLIAVLRATMPIQATALIMIAVLAVLLYQQENKLTDSDPAQLAESQPLSPAPALEKTTVGADRKQSFGSPLPNAPEVKQENRRATTLTKKEIARARQEQASTKDQAAPVAGAEADKPSESRIAAPRRPAIQAQEVATGRGSFQPSTDAFGFGSAIGALSPTPLRNAPVAAPERAFSPLSEPSADIELIVRRRPLERLGDPTEDSSVASRSRSEADATIASAAVKRTVPAPGSPASSIVEMRWFGVPADRYDQFRKHLAAEAHIDSERSISGLDKEFSSKSSRELLIKVIILPSER